MILQSMMLHTDLISCDTKLFYRSNRSYEAFPIALGIGDTISFDTFYNSFPIGMWKQYTSIEDLHVSVRFQGQIKINVYGANTKKTQCIVEKDACNDEMNDTEIDISIDAMYDDSVIYVSITGESASTTLAHCYIGTHQIEQQNITLALNFCTYKKEKAITNNVMAIQEYLSANTTTYLKDKLSIYVTDNGKTLDKSTFDYKNVFLNYNKNLGGAGGFTRGLIEILSSNTQYSHVIFMDDDIVVLPQVLEKTLAFLSFLKDECKDICVGGSMLKMDNPSILYEAGARIAKGRVQSLNKNLDIADFSNVLINCQQQEIEYQAWWYCCFSLNTLSLDNLPMPFFIHWDDIEYSLRTQKKIINMNGIAVWHESFEHKSVPFFIYYDFRNTAITNAIHNPNYKKSQMKMQLLKSIVKQCIRFRYKECALSFRAAEDFCKGVSWFCEQDGEDLHKEITQIKYDERPIEDVMAEFNKIDCELSTEKDLFRLKSDWLYAILLNGWVFPSKYKLSIPKMSAKLKCFYRVGTAINYDDKVAFISKRSWKELFGCLFKYMAVGRLIDREFNNVVADYKQNYMQLTNVGYWEGCYASE